MSDAGRELTGQLGVAAKRYLEHSGFGFMMFVNGYRARNVLMTMTDRVQ